MDMYADRIRYSVEYHLVNTLVGQYRNDTNDSDEYLFMIIVCNSNLMPHFI